MKINFNFTLTEDKALEYLYEFIMSHSESYFGVPNCNVIYSINLSFENFEMKVSFDSDNGDMQYLRKEDLKETNNTIKYSYVDTKNSIIQIKKGTILLPNDETRIIQFTQPQLKKEIAKMLYYLVNKSLKIHYHDATIQFDREHGVIKYHGCANTCFVFRTKLSDLQKEIGKYI